MNSKRYCLSSKYFLKAVRSIIPMPRPEESADREGEWTCGHGPCPVRQVRLRVRSPFDAHLPRLRCPLCLRTLVFRRWL